MQRRQVISTAFTAIAVALWVGPPVGLSAGELGFTGDLERDELE